ncbi:MAG: nuclear transport factor 2 family protein [Rhodospirillaceae bacterium]|nr:nuclear transport factor 2 family protein [Rhodospirillaceae bacterium]
MKTKKHIASLGLALACGIGVGALSMGSFAQGTAMRWVQGEYPAAFEASMDASSAAFERKDMEATRSHLAEDFATYELHGPGSPKLLVKGREETIKVMNTFFAGDFGSSWDGAEVEKLGSIGNTMVQIEYDRYNMESGQITIPTFVIIQYKDNKRWREWRLRPDPA